MYNLRTAEEFLKYMTHINFSTGKYFNVKNEQFFFVPEFEILSESFWAIVVGFMLNTEAMADITRIFAYALRTTTDYASLATT
jgi:hypothetical protein